VLRQYRRRWLVLTPDKLYTFAKERGYGAPPTEEVRSAARPRAIAPTREHPAADAARARVRRST
jgi:hypothetical protein